MKNNKNNKILLDNIMLYQIKLGQLRQKETKIMSEKKKAYLVKDIPEKDWRDFRIKLLQDGFDTYNEALLNLIEKYANDKLAEFQD